MQLSPILRAGTTALKRMHVPLFLSKYSRKDFTVHQHLLLCAVRELEKGTWRGLVDRIEDGKAVDEHLGLKRTPHFTTPQKFLQRIPKAWFRLLLKRMVDLLVSEYRVSADATCFRLRSASTHYLQRLGEAIPLFAICALPDHPLPVYNTGGNSRSVSTRRITAGPFACLLKRTGSRGRRSTSGPASGGRSGGGRRPRSGSCRILTRGTGRPGRRGSAGRP